MTLAILNQSEVSISEAFLKKWVKAVQAELTKREVLDAARAKLELTLVFLDTVPAKKINWQFRGKDYATDVLSFETMEEGSLGELVMCPQVLQKQADEHKQTFNLELGYMILHGILHLLGYDHEKSEDEAKKMLGIQDEVFEKLRKLK
jgi:probable rRNA maturation factor